MDTKIQREIAIALMSLESIKYRDSGFDRIAKIVGYYNNNRVNMSHIPSAILACEAMRTSNFDGLAREYGELDYALYQDLARILEPRN